MDELNGFPVSRRELLGGGAAAAAATAAPMSAEAAEGAVNAQAPTMPCSFEVNGQQRDPLMMARQSESVPVAAASKPQFLRAAANVRVQLSAASQMQTVSAQ